MAPAHDWLMLEDHHQPPHLPYDGSQLMLRRVFLSSIICETAMLSAGLVNGRLPPYSEATEQMAKSATFIIAAPS